MTQNIDPFVRYSEFVHFAIVVFVSRDLKFYSGTNRQFCLSVVCFSCHSISLKNNHSEFTWRISDWLLFIRLVLRVAAWPSSDRKCQISRYVLLLYHRSERIDYDSKFHQFEWHSHGLVFVHIFPFFFSPRKCTFLFWKIYNCSSAF